MNFLIRVKHILQKNSFETDSEEVRAQERHRHIFLTSLASGFAMLLNIVISLIVIPLSFGYLGVERFGLWMAISSAVAMLGFADLGVGSGLMNAVSYAHGKDDNNDIRRKIMAGLLLLGLIGVVVIIVFIAFYPRIEWSSLFKTSSSLAIEELAPTIAVVVLFFALSIPAGVGPKVMMGLQMGAYANIWRSIGSVAGLVAVLAVIDSKGGLPYLALATVAPPVIVSVLAGFYFFYMQRSSLRPKLSELSIHEVKGLANVSGLFLVLQISGLVAFQSDNLIISHYLGSESVAIYAVAFKLFTLPTVFIGLFLAAMWPAYAEAYSRGDKEWIYKTFSKSIRLSSIIVFPIALVLLFFGKFIIEKWVGRAAVPSWNLLIGLFFWAVLNIFGGNFAVVLNGFGIIRFQVITSASMAIVNIILSVWLVQLIGVAGAVWGSVLSLAFINYLPTAIYLRKYFKSGIGAPIEKNS